MSGFRRQPGRLGPYVEGYRSRLLEWGYAPATVRWKLQLLGQLGRWMQDEGLAVAELRTSTLEAFLAARRAGGYRRAPGLRSLSPLLAFLKTEGVVVVDDPAPSTPLDEVLGRYRQWMITDRVLAPTTIVRYESLARRFLQSRASAGDALGVQDLGGAAVTGFLLMECGRLKLGSAKARVAELRSLLRFLHVKGLTPFDLAGVVPPVAGWRDTGVPRAIAPAAVQKLLDSCDRARLVGARDFAILLLLARLGLRAAEVASIELSDLDWRAGEIVVRGKGQRRDRSFPATWVRPSPPTCVCSEGGKPSGRSGEVGARQRLTPPRRPVRTHRPSRPPAAAPRRAAAAVARPVPERAHQWADKIASFDGFVIVTAEYNHGIPGVLKNAIDYPYAEWNNKAVGFVSYGSAGGARAVEQLRLVAGELQLADVRQQVVLSLATEFENYRIFKPGEYNLAALNTMLDQVIAWSRALAPLRAASPVAA